MADASWQRQNMKKTSPADPCCDGPRTMHPKIAKAVNCPKGGDGDGMADGGTVGRMKVANAAYADGGTIGERISGFFSNPDTSPVFGGMREGSTPSGASNAQDIAAEKMRKEDYASKVRDSDEGHVGFGEGTKRTEIKATVTTPEKPIVEVNAPAEGAVKRVPTSAPGEAPELTRAPAPAAPAPAKAAPKPSTTTAAEDARETKTMKQGALSRGQKAGKSFGAALQNIGQGQIEAARFFKPLKTDFKS